MCEKYALIKQIRKQLFPESGFSCLCIDLSTIHYFAEKARVSDTKFKCKIPRS